MLESRLRVRSLPRAELSFGDTTLRQTLPILLRYETVVKHGPEEHRKRDPVVLEPPLDQYMSRSVRASLCQALTRYQMHSALTFLRLIVFMSNNSGVGCAAKPRTY